MHMLGEKHELKTCEEEQLLAEAAQLRQLPAFPEAVRAYTVGLTRFRESPRLINKMISYETRFRVVGYLLYLHADREMTGFDGGVTYGQLLELCTRRQEVSPRVLKNVLALLKLTGFVKTLRGETDRRLKFYYPTPRMFDFVQQWLTYAVKALDVLQPEMRRTQMLRDDPRFIERFLVSGGRDHIADEPPADRMPDFIAFFGAREGAAAVILAVMLADIDHTPTPSRGDIAKQFGLSKTQVANLINEGTKLGLLALNEAVPTPTQYLHDSYDRWISIECAFYARHMRQA